MLGRRAATPAHGDSSAFSLSYRFFVIFTLRMSRLSTALSLALIACALIVRADAQEIPPLAEMRAKVEAYVKRTFPVFDPAKARVEYADLNGDGLPEAFVAVREPSCGEDGCAFVLDIADDTAREIAAFAGGELRALQTKSGGWRDIALDGRRLRWRNGIYEQP